MKKTDEIKKLSETNYNLKRSKYEYFPKTNEELIELVNMFISKYGDFIDLNNVCVSYIDDFGNVFMYKKTFNGDVSEWDVSKGINFYYMFRECYKFDPDLSNWDVSNGLYFGCMFYECKSFNSDLSRWDVSKGVDFRYMFYECKSFNSDLSQWDVSKGEKFNDMFYGTKLFNADLSNWDVSNATCWLSFAFYSLLRKYPERIPEKFRKDYL
jgi:surface protein